MFVAKKDLILDDGTIVKYGDPVPSFLNWTDNARRSHLNLGWVVEEPDVFPSEKTDKATEGESVSAFSDSPAPLEVVKATIECETCHRQFGTKRALTMHKKRSH